MEKKEIDTLPSVEVVATPVAVEITSVYPSAPPAYDSDEDAVGTRPAVKPSALVDLVAVLRRELHVDGNKNMSLGEVVEKSCEMLGVSLTAGNLIERAGLCYDQIFHGSSQQQRMSRVGKTDFTMSDKSWEAGRPGEGWESFSNNPWKFRKDGSFVTERDGCTGFYSLTPDVTAPGEMKLRLDWEGEQRGVWAEYKMEKPDSDPLFICSDASPGLQTWDIRQVPPSQVKPVEQKRTYVAPPILKAVVMKRTDAASVRGVAEMRKMAELYDSTSGPHRHQQHRYLWFDNHSNWKSAYPLHRAAMRGDIETLLTLLQEGRDVNEAMGPWYNTQPLAWAAEFNQLQALALLVEYGADLEHRNKQGFSAMDAAESARHQGAALVLEAFFRAASGGDHAGQGTRGRQHEDNWARIWCPIAGHPVVGADAGAYDHPAGCCCFVMDRRAGSDPNCEITPCLVGTPLLCLWMVTLCYQPCGWMRGEWLWLGDCPCSEQRVTHSFVEQNPANITRGPAKHRYDNGIPTRYTHY